MFVLANMPIRKKLLIIIMLISCVALFLTSTAYFVSQILASRHSMVDELTTMALITGSNSAAAISFDDSESAKQTLSFLQTDRRIRKAVISNGQEVFAWYNRDVSEATSQVLLTERQKMLLNLSNGEFFTSTSLSVVRHISLDNEKIATILLEMDNDALRLATIQFLIIGLIVSVATLLICYLLSSWLEKMVSAPVLELVKAMETVSQDKNYQLRVRKKTKDELGVLYDGFNEMLEQIQQRDNKLLFTQYSIDHTGDAAYWMDSSGDFFYVNHAAAQIVGMSLDELKVSNIKEIAPSFTEGKWQWFWQELQNMGSSIIETELRRKSDGRLIQVEMKANYVKYRNQSYNCAMVRDISNRKRLEDQLQQAEKMKAIGTLAAGVAHDLNNILSGVTTYPQLLLLDLPEDSMMREPLESIRKSGQNAAAIVQDMLTLSRRGVAVSKVINLNTMVEEYVSSAEFADQLKAHPHIELKTSLAPDLLPIKGSSIHLAKTVMNLLLNGLEAISAKGGVSVSTNNCVISSAFSGYENIPVGDYAVLKVSDTGSGIAKEDLQRIFEPFYSKKKMGRSGTGLGMTVVWTTVKDYDGFIDLKSEPGEGTSFKLYFPVTREDVEQSKDDIEAEECRGEEMVLVVDDVAEQRTIAYTMLTRLGYKVVTAESGEDCLEFLKNNSVDIVVLDMLMDPGMNGLETYREIIKLHPGQKAVIASGYSENELVKEVQKFGAGEYVRKPYSIEELSLALRRELENTKI